MKNALKLYQRFWSIEIQKQLLYQPIMAIFSYIAHISWVSFSFVFLLIVSEPLAARPQLELLLFLSYFHTVKGLFWIHSSWSSAFLAGSAFREGKIDFYLLKPLNSQWFISSFRPNIFAISDFLIGIASSLYFFSRLSLLSPSTIAVYFLVSLTSAVLLYSLWFSYLTLFVPSGEASAVHSVINLFWVYGEYPVSIYHGLTKFMTTIIFPVVLITTLPVAILLGQKPSIWVTVLITISLVFFLISTKLWNRMLKFYASSS